ncbi:hypothetical protein COV82_05675 [Candidatus Peregrinibacteria bacterium CG11_big_fil_rev_8_21_14_0_20_46_8]|nr:MAG: hypothetical protein COV82_05675 [Candidatus Peregrinibacteria bacterium CG11_big_fil_rev_8_21_14_0_20_46_8]
MAENTDKNKNILPAAQPVAAPPALPAQPMVPEQAASQPAAQSPSASPQEPDDSSYKLDTSGQPKESFGFLKNLLSKKSAAAGDADDGNAFTKLFGKQDPAMRSTAPSLSKVLGPQPKISATDMFDKEKRRRALAGRAFGFAVFAALAVYTFFYLQLNPNATILQKHFGPNIAIQFDASNARLEKAKTDLNIANYMRARVLLDDVNSKIDPYQKQVAIVTSDFVTDSERAIAEVQEQELGAEIKKKLVHVQDIFKAPLGIDTFSVEPVTPMQRDQKFQALLVQALGERKQQLHAAAPEGEVVETNALDNVIRLAENQYFINTITNSNLEEMETKAFSELLENIRAQGTDEHSAVQNIIKQRLRWSEVIRDVHAVTEKVDDLYGLGFFDTVGGIQYNSYSFDAQTGKISIRGTTKTSDSKTFSFISELVERIEGSRKFKNVDLPSFSKSKDEEGDYTSSLSLVFELQPADERDPRDDRLTEDLEVIESAQPESAQ